MVDSVVDVDTNDNGKAPATNAASAPRSTKWAVLKRDVFSLHNVEI